jgi:acetyl-CoA acyltransferase
MREVAILSAVRTPIGRAPRGIFKNTRPDDLAAAVARDAMRRAEVEPTAIEDVVLGCANPEAEQGLNVARQVGFLAGLPDSVPAMTINRFCSSGLQAAAIVADRIATGGIDAGLAGGLESMSMIPMGGNKVALSPSVVEQFPNAYIPMGNTAENVARQFGVSRGDQDAFALASHQKAVAAQTRGDFAAEILPIKTRVFDGEVWRDITVDRDEGPRADTSLDKLAALKPVFDPTGTVTAGNSSPLNDGAAAVVLMSGERANRTGARPLARIVAYATGGGPPKELFFAPVDAVNKLMAKMGVSIGHFDLIEANEAFAAQALADGKLLGWD